MIIPADRLYPWQGAVGVPGGIPNRTDIAATVNAANFGNGTIDATQAIRSAVAACGPNQVALLSAGTFLVNGTIFGTVNGNNDTPRKGNFTLRGAGQGLTTIKANSALGTMLYFGAADYPNNGYPTVGVPITGGATRGNAVVTLGNTSTFAVGKLCHIQQNDISYVKGAVTPAQLVVFKVAGVTPTTVTLNHPLPCDFTNLPSLVTYSTPPISGVGVEGLTLDGNNTAGSGIQGEQLWGCWFKDVGIRRSRARQMFLIVFNQSEVRHCYTRETYTLSGPGHEGIDFFNRSCFNLVEDNICDNGGFPAIIMGDSREGSCCNVISYNFCKNAATGSTIGGADISFNHGAHNMFNLCEGNIVGNGISSDGYFGSASHNTIFRNWAAAKPYTAGIPTSFTTVNGIRAIQLNRMSNYFNVVGNVLGDSSFSTSAGVGAYAPENVNYGELQVIYQMGYPNLGNQGFSGVRAATNPPDYYSPDEGYIQGGGYQQWDGNVKGSIIRHGNYDYFNNALLWDAANPDHALPSSYYLAAKPAWFGNLVWPPIDPANPPGAFSSNTNISKIPAGYRYVNGVDPGGGGPIPPTISVSPSSLDFGAVPVGEVRDLTVSVDNVGEGTVSGSASTSTPFSVASGSPYTVTTGTADVTIRYTPAAASTSNDTAVFTGGGGTSIPISGTGTSAIVGLTWAADAGTISLPFEVDGSHHVFQSPEVTPNPADGGRAAYTFTIAAAGDYRIVINVNAADDGSNSFFVNIDAEPTVNELWPITKYTTGFEDRTVAWLGNSPDPSNPQFPNKVFTLTAAQHTLIIRGRESDTYLGQITITPAAALNPPGIPSAPNPANAAVDVAISANLSWTATDATTYDLKFGDVNPPPQVASGLVTPFYDPLSLNYSTTYFWQVTARNADGNTVGPVWSFTTTAPVEVISSPSPANGALGVALNPVLRWNGAGDSYDVYLDDISPPVTVYADQVSNSFDVSVIRGPLDYSTPYYWKIVSNHASGPDVTGPEWSFTTMDLPTTVPVPKIIIVS